ncbi:MAG: NADH-quinone oxidoreductase subunit NuoN [Gammaproteobacteria bacterium]|nr:NADH-quinone oxidoreductase subunit NuoN [Gammaproteobacteria bacterium]
MDNLSIATPEIFMLIATSAVLLVGLFIPEENRRITYWLAQASLAATLVLSLSQLGSGTISGFRGAYGIDPMSVVLKSWIIVVAMGGFLYSRDYLATRRIANGEYYVLGLFAVTGMMVMVSAINMLTVYLGLELLALSLYAMVGLYRSNSGASEAAMKYFVLGALASGMLLYGMSMIYGATGSLDLATIKDILSGGEQRSTGARFGLVFVIVGIAFKLGAVPFHMWVPDVYDGAPTSVALFIATAPKIAAFAMIIRLLVNGLETLSLDWQMMLAIIAALSMIVGNLVAIAQTNIKRMLGYSTISHVGFLLLGIISADAAGYSAAMFYAITYAFTTLAAFGVVLVLSRGGYEAVMLDDLTGLAKRNSLLAVVMMLAMISLAGVPPVVGFYAKLSVLKAAISADFVWLAIVGVAMSVIGAFYYLRVIKLMYFDDPVNVDEVVAAPDVSAGLAVNAVAVVVLGLFPGLIMSACIAAFA